MNTKNINSKNIVWILLLLIAIILFRVDKYPREYNSLYCFRLTKKVEGLYGSSLILLGMFLTFFEYYKTFITYVVCTIPVLYCILHNAECL